MDYRRARVQGATYFFTLVTERRRALLVEHIDRLRDPLRYIQARYPFTIDAIVVLPDRLHAIWTLPQDDSDYSTRRGQVKRKFSSGLPAMSSNPSQASQREKGIWQRRFWEHCIRDEADWRRHMDYIHYNPSNTATSSGYGTGRTAPFIASSSGGGTTKTGEMRSPMQCLRWITNRVDRETGRHILQRSQRNWIQ